MYEYAATLLEVHDGDTLTCWVDQGLDEQGHRLTLRLAGVDCPELATPEGRLAHQFTVDWLLAHAGRKPLPLFGVSPTVEARTVLLRTQRDRREKFGRWLADVLSPDGAAHLNAALIDAGHARPYVGGRR